MSHTELADTIRIISARRMTESDDSMSNSENDDLRPEYDLEKLGAGVRGNHHKAYQESTNVVVIDPDLRREFPNSKAVNDALREVVKSRGRAP